MILLSTIEEEVRARVGADESANLASFVHTACNYYSQFNPFLIEETLPLLSGEDSYELPEGVTGVRRIDWWPYGEKKTARDLLENPDLIAHDETKFTFKRLRDLDLYRCRWYIELNILTVFPTPSQDLDVEVDYIAPHEYNSSLGSYPTIPDEDESIIVALGMAEYLSAQQAQMAMLPDFSEGMTSITRRHMVGNLERVIEQLREQVKTKYGR